MRIILRVNINELIGRWFFVLLCIWLQLSDIVRYTVWQLSIFSAFEPVNLSIVYMQTWRRIIPSFFHSLTHFCLLAYSQYTRGFGLFFFCFYWLALGAIYVWYLRTTLVAYTHNSKHNVCSRFDIAFALSFKNSHPSNENVDDDEDEEEEEQQQQM